jgi:hypothetical protein
VPGKPSSSRSSRSRPASQADLAKLKKSLDDCTDEIERLKREVEINIRRMAAMQAEIDHLRVKP